MHPYEKIKVGADPEVFVFNTADGSYVSGHDLIPGTKWAPHPVKHGAVQVDGMALEFNIEPATSDLNFIHNIGSVFDQLSNMVKEQNPMLELRATPVADFSQEYFDGLPYMVKELGCEPDFDANTSKPNPKPNGDRPFRTASGHIHIGWAKAIDAYAPEHFADCCEIVKELDGALFLPSLLWDKDTRRRSLYGNRGAFRPKAYGLEYRVLSNAWLRDTLLMGWIYKTVENVMALRVYGYGPSSLGKDYTDTLGRDPTSFSKEEILNYLDRLQEWGICDPLPEKYTV